MKKVRILALTALAVSALSFIACGSTPEPEAAPVEPVVEEPVETPAVEEPSEDYSDANKALLAKVEESRKAAVAAGAEDADPNGLAAADAVLEAQKALADSGAGDMSAVLNDLNDRYLALEAYAKAKAKKDKIDSLDYSGYNKPSYDAGVKILEDLARPESNLVPGANRLKQAQSAEGAFDAVLNSAFKALAKEERTAAYEAKKLADGVKASVSRKTDYDAAVKNFKDGDSNYVTGNPEGALANYTKAKESFNGLYNDIADKRAKAQAAIEAAKARVQESENAAIEADAQAPLGDGEVEGIEDENARLLEEDDFTAAENSTVEVSSDIAEPVEEANE
ncbi:hypothetical protein [Treponema sp.]|jgi:hypothetical protein|uniref:hypothetical protein n=1 Tax=Treponema sp. TaxID=166 RepID=UPI00257EAA65|nr:hypothetical protein [Treponema sp.]MBE6354836.1 hypothetical protein [Treponema sp.]